MLGSSLLPQRRGSRIGRGILLELVFGSGRLARPTSLVENRHRDLHAQECRRPAEERSPKRQHCAWSHATATSTRVRSPMTLLVRSKSTHPAPRRYAGCHAWVAPPPTAIVGSASGAK